jgi:hypothetical protein
VTVLMNAVVDQIGRAFMHGTLPTFSHSARKIRLGNRRQLQRFLGKIAQLRRITLIVAATLRKGSTTVDHPVALKCAARIAERSRDRG